MFLFLTAVKVTVSEGATSLPISGPAHVVEFALPRNIAIGAETPWGVGAPLDDLLPGTTSIRLTADDLEGLADPASDPMCRSWAMIETGIVSLMRGDVAACARSSEEAIEWCRAAGESWTQVVHLHMLAASTWQLVTNVTGTGAPITVQDNTATNTSRFYRIQVR